jgi:S1-C subfamily serine protease
VAVSLHHRPGHWGGPPVDARGNLVGIRTMMAGPVVGVAVPADAIKQSLRNKVRVPTTRAE